MTKLTFNGKCLGDYHVLADERGTFIKPDVDIAKIKIPGRSGTFTYSNHRYDNVTIEYDCAINGSFYEDYPALMAHLLQDGEYHRLEGMAQKDFYRMARFKGSSDPDVSAWFQSGEFELSFDCKPQLFLKTGEEPITLAASGQILNPFLYDALPLLRVYGWGTLQVGSGSITIASDVGEYIDIDCDIKDAHRGLLNCNSFITVTSWPTLPVGLSDIVLPSTISKVEIAPRWWTL